MTRSDRRFHTPSMSARGRTAPKIRNIPLLIARVLAGVLGVVQLAGVVFFVFVIPEERSGSARWSTSQW